MAQTYFACTLGQASQLKPHPFLSLNHLLDVQAEAHPNLPVVGMPVPKDSEEWGIHILTYRDLLCSTTAMAHHLTQEGLLPTRTIEDGTKSMTIGLLCPSSLDFLVMLFATMRMGLSVLLIAPQCTPAAVAHLCSVSSITHLVYDASLLGLAKAAFAGTTIGSPSVKLVPLPAPSTWTDAPSDKHVPYPTVLSSEGESLSTCFIYHSSGTTSGLPKPLPQNHRTMSVLHPRIPNAPAAFSTTPLYHGGLADLVRSLNSEAMLYLFPPDVPITKYNILKSLDACSRYGSEVSDDLKYHCQIKYFSCVPHILKMLVEGEEAGGSTMKILKGLDMLGTGGAPLPKELGDRMVEEGVHLISRYGSAECGFLMSSARDFKDDREWQYLRSDGSGGALVFEQQEEEDGEEIAELVIQPSWPCITKTNRPDGSFATGDLYSKHPTLPEAWKYLGRKDDMLVLVNGKKVDPVPFEAALNSTASTTSIQEAVVFGVNRAYIGVMIVPSEGADEEQVRQQAWNIVNSTNAAVSGHARVSSKDMIAVLPSSASFSKSSKGTVQRPLVYKHYDDIISRTYDSFETGTANLKKVVISSLKDAQEYVLDVIQQVAPSSSKAYGQQGLVDLDTDLFSWGVDSLQSTRIRNRLQAELELGGQELSSNIVYEYATARRLASVLFAKITGTIEEHVENELDLMREMVHKYCNFEGKPENSTTNLQRNSTLRVLVLTGVTGGLGVHLLDQLLKHRAPSYDEVVCLVRAEDDHAAYRRVLASFADRQLSSLTGSSLKITCYAARLGDEHLGLDSATYQELVIKVTDIIHAAWAVNFVGGLRSFEADHIRGMYNLIRLATKATGTLPVRFYFCSSGASVLGQPPSSPIMERISDDPASAFKLGYAQSKWVAEGICAAAWRGPLKGRVGVLRVGQLCGDTQHGLWNENEGWPLMLRTVDDVGALPKLDQDVFWLPVDTAAVAILDIVLSSRRSSRLENDECQVLHVMNPNPTSWNDILTWLREYGKKFESMIPTEWVKAVAASEPDAEKNPSRKLLGLWMSAYGPNYSSKPETMFDSRQAEMIAPLLKSAAIDRDLMFKTFQRWTESGFLKANI